MKEYILRLKNLSLRDKAKVGTKNASLGEILNNPALKEIKVTDGFAITAQAYKHYIEYNKLDGLHNNLLAKIDKEDLSKLREIGKECRELILGARMPGDLYSHIVSAYHILGSDSDITVAVRSSSLTEDFDQQGKKDKHDTFLNVKGELDLIDAVKKCFASLYSDSALMEDEFVENQAISVGVQKMLGDEKSCSGFAFTADPETGFKDVIHVSSVCGFKDNDLKEMNEYIVYKPILNLGVKSIIQKRLDIAKKQIGEVSDSELPILETRFPETVCEKYSMNEEEILTIAQWGIILENFYKKHMSIEWKKDGLTDDVYLLQAKPLKLKKM